jgi:hypothetical protein
MRALLSERIAPMALAGASRTRLTQTLEAAFAEGLISEETFHRRVDAVLGPKLIRPDEVIGDLTFRGRSARARITAAVTTIAGRLEDLFADAVEQPWTLLALDWPSADRQLVVGRHQACDVVLSDLSVSRRHARLIPRDGRWIPQDLASTNGTIVNGLRVGRCELRPGDCILVGAERLRVD